jgi:hypothetical protein
VRLLACIGAALVTLAGCAPQEIIVQTPAAPAAVVDMFAPGARVVIKSRSGTFKPVDTGHAVEVNGIAGKTGTVVSKLGESVRVRFDAQTWDEFPPNGVSVQLQPFEATIHASYLGPAG